MIAGSSLRKWTVLGSVSVLLVTALQLLSVKPAAALPGLTKVSALTPVNTLTFKSVEVLCPAGTQVVGGGADILGAQGRTMITESRPLPGLNGFYADGYISFFITGVGPMWALRVHALCANVPGLELRTATVFTPATSATAVCPAGKRVLGAGGAVNPGRGVIMLNAIVPGTSTVTAKGYPLPGWSGDITAYALCAPVGQVAIATGTAPPPVATASCPAASFTHGTGADLIDGAHYIFLHALMPNNALNQATVRAFQGVPPHPQHPGVPPWTVRAHATCTP